ncbi:hypothetical protein SNE40_003305 [Patella caerulea]|uniref:Uncharacterized protein n=1 Tax=Patella caerulea TaxID=87958 RepID=A0AAN8K9H8_PATCE
MPLIPGSEYGSGWQFQQPAVYPVYNNKRKHSNEDHEETMCLESGTAPSKRLCQQQFRESQQHFEESQQMEQSEINHNTIHQDLNHQSQFLPVSDQHQEIHGCIKDVAAAPCFQNSQQIESQNIAQPQNDMIMDLCDETYSNSTLENEACLDIMDNDCVPNNQQYTRQVADCNNCIGERSPSASRVRCYCKPTWDNFMDLRPYISDYY